jgi:uncharacterized protein (DUF2235 family)
MPKNIVICCDGTGNEFGRSNSNVVKLYSVLERSQSQIAYYHPGVGTMGSRNALSQLGKMWTRVIGLAFGYGLSDNIADAYQFLMQTFEPSDSIFVFGFSRGAYTARALCGMLHCVGLLTEGNGGLIPYAIRILKSKKLDFSTAAAFKETFSRNCTVRFVGAWDTVSSVGWVYDAVRFPFTKAAANPSMRIIRHAVSIDERRGFFRQNLFGDPHDATQDVQEVWFTGVHSDVGGSYPETESQLSKLALRWMLCEAELAGLRLDQQRMSDVLGQATHYVQPDPLTLNQHESLRGAWWIAEFWPKIVHAKTVRGTWKKSIHVNLGRRRWIAANSLIHQSVEKRLQSPALDYRPANLPEARGTANDRCVVPNQQAGVSVSGKEGSIYER